MKSTLATLTLAVTTALSIAAPAPAHAQWQPGHFQVYLFRVGQGDSQLIVSPTGETLLIDVAEKSSNSHATADYVAARIRWIMGDQYDDHIDTVVATHLHLDHIGTAGTGGIWSLVEQQGFTIGKLVDRDAGEWIDADDDGVCEQAEIHWHNMGSGSNSGTPWKWLCYVLHPDNAATLRREIAQVGSTTQIDMGAQVVVEVIEVDAQGVMIPGTSTPVAGDHTSESAPPSENDYSITLKISFGDLDYLTGGDTDGDFKVSSHTYYDVEEVIASRIGDVEVFKANHHGSHWSNSADFLTVLDPEVTLVSCGWNNTHHHPDPVTLTRLEGTSAVYFTERCWHAWDYSDTTIVTGDIVLDSTDGQYYTVDGVTYTASAAVSVADVVINEVLPDPHTVFRKEWVELYNPTAYDIDLSGAVIDDVRGGGSAPYTVPADTIIEAQGYWVLSRAFVFNNAGDEVNLVTPDGTVVDSVTYDASENDRSWARVPDAGAWIRLWTALPTRGAANPATDGP